MKIGKITLTTQAFVVFLIQFVIAISLFFIFRKKPIVATGAFLGAFAFGSYATYLTNCTVVGDCEVLAWVLVGLNIIALISLPMRLKMLKNIK